MKKQNRKGFTIVELVIVIAVIAILAGVLIPTFASVVRKANISADTSVAKNLNTVLTMAEAEGNKPQTFSEVLTVLRENGYVVANLNPTTSKCYFVWESDSNQFLLVDGGNNYNVLYNAKDYTAAGATWHFAVSNGETANAILTYFNNTVVVKYTPASVDELNSALNKVYKEGGKQEVVITEDVVLSSNADEYTILDKAGSEIVIDLGDNTMTTAASKDHTFAVNGRPSGSATKKYTQFSAAQGEMHLSNGTLVSATDSAYVVSAANTGKVYLKNVTVEGNKGVVLRVLGYTTDATKTDRAHLEIKDSTVIATNAGGIECGSGTATFTNVNVTTSGTGDFTFCLSASYGGVLTVESGTYLNKTAKGVIGFYSSEGTVNIKGGTFTNEVDANNIFDFEYGLSGRPAGSKQAVNITGGTFAGQVWNTITADGWAVLCGYADNAAAAAAGLTITVTDAQVTIVYAN